MKPKTGPDKLINILGGGAIGSLWACQCELKQIPYRLYSRHPRRLKLKLQSQHKVYPLLLQSYAYDEWLEADFNLICVKAFALEGLVNRLGAILWQQAPPVLMMNGMGLDAIFQHAGYSGPVIQASFVQGARFIDSGHSLTLAHTGNGKTQLGFVQPGIEAYRLTREITAQLNRILPMVVWQPNQHQQLWLKVLTNAVINPLTALSGQPNGSLLSNGKLCAEAKTLLDEVWPIAAPNLQGYALDDVQRNIEDIARQTATNHSSMLQDIRAGRTTEIDFINGFLLSQAKSMGITLQGHQAIVTAIKKATADN